MGERGEPTLNRELLLAIVQDVNREMGADRGYCPYLDRWEGVEGAEDATCGYGCRDEPECVTCEPEGGWPSRREGFDYESAYVDELAGSLAANWHELAGEQTA